MRLIRTGTAALVLLAVLAGGCGGDDPAAGSAENTPTAPDTVWAGEAALHFAGFGPFDTRMQAFYLHHDSDDYEIRVTSPGSKAASEEIVETIRSTWEWR
jgi:hypothetical protein